MNTKLTAKPLFWFTAVQIVIIAFGVATAHLYFTIADYHQQLGYDRGVAETRVIAYDPNKCAAPTSGGSFDGRNEPRNAITPFQDSEILFWKNP